MPDADQPRKNGKWTLTGQANTQSDKEYWQRNKEKVKAQHDRYRRENRDKINDKRKDRRWCDGYSLAERFANGKACAAKRGIEFSLTCEEPAATISLPCHYCGGGFGEKTRASLGLDRLDSKSGYVARNVVSCCRICNNN
jgi:hypothetical protein